MSNLSNCFNKTQLSHIFQLIHVFAKQLNLYFLQISNTAWLNAEIQMLFLRIDNF